MNRFLAAKERAEQKGNEWKFGSLRECRYPIPFGNRLAYLPPGEQQRSEKDDTQDCATRSIVNGWEAKFTYAYRHDLMLPENKKWLARKGYVVWKDGLPYVLFADAFNAIKSGTTREGNSLKAPLDSTRKHGLIPKHLLPLEKWMTWDDYHNPARITRGMERLGQEFADRFLLAYEKVPNTQFKEAIKKGMLDVAGYAWPVPANGVYPRIAYPANHAWLNYDNNFDAFDNYIPFVKNLAPDFAFWDWGYHFAVVGERTAADIQREYGILARILEAARDMLANIARNIRYA